MQTFGMIVTAEPYFAVNQPGNMVVMENIVGAATVGRQENIEARYELLGRGTYSATNTKIQDAIFGIDRKTPRVLFEARNAVRIANLAAADKYAPSILSSATQQLRKAEEAYVQKRDKSTVETLARETVSTAEEARVMAVKQKAEEEAQAKAAADKKAAEDREAKARDFCKRFAERAFRRPLSDEQKTLYIDRQFETAHMVLDQAYRQLIGLSPEAVLERNPNDLIARLRFDEAPAAGRDKCLALATLLRASGDIAAAQGDSSTAADAYHKALLVLLDTVLRDPGLALPDYVPTIESLDAELSAHALPVTTRQELLLYYEQAGVYAKAEDILWAMLQAAPGDCAIVGAGRALYARLQHLGDAALIAGNLPRDEVDGGLADLDAYAGEHGC
jgi:hypothetical protein